MAVPSAIIAGIGTFVSSNGAITVPVPGTLAGNYAAGDRLYLAIESANETIATPSGWTQVVQLGAGTAAAAGGVRLGLFTKIAGASEASLVVADSGNHTCGQMFAVRNASAAKVLYQGETGAMATYAFLTKTVTGFTPHEGDLLVTVAAVDNDVAGATINMTTQYPAAASITTRPGNVSGALSGTANTTSTQAGGGISIHTDGQFAGSSLSAEVAIDATTPVTSLLLQCVSSVALTNSITVSLLFSTAIELRTPAATPNPVATRYSAYKLSNGSAYLKFMAAKAGSPDVVYRLDVVGTVQTVYKSTTGPAGVFTQVASATLTTIPNSLYVSAQNVLIVTTDTYVARFSLDDGATWTAMTYSTIDFNGTSGTRVCSINNEAVLIISSLNFKYLFYSTDKGLTWLTSVSISSNPYYWATGALTTYIYTQNNYVGFTAHPWSNYSPAFTYFAALPTTTPIQVSITRFSEYIDNTCVFNGVVYILTRNRTQIWAAPDIFTQSGWYTIALPFTFTGPGYIGSSNGYLYILADKVDSPTVWWTKDLVTWNSYVIPDRGFIDTSGYAYIGKTISDSGNGSVYLTFGNVTSSVSTAVKSYIYEIDFTKDYSDSPRARVWANELGSNVQILSIDGVAYTVAAGSGTLTNVNPIHAAAATTASVVLANLSKGTVMLHAHLTTYPVQLNDVVVMGSPTVAAIGGYYQNSAYANSVSMQVMADNGSGTAIFTGYYYSDTEYYAAAGRQQIYRSTDYGQSWKAIAVPIAYSRFGAVVWMGSQFLAFPVHPDTLFYTYYTSPDGLEWTKVVTATVQENTSGTITYFVKTIIPITSTTAHLHIGRFAGGTFEEAYIRTLDTATATLSSLVTCMQTNLISLAKIARMHKVPGSTRLFGGPATSSALWYSDDSGATWESVQPNGYNLSQCFFIQPLDGKIALASDTYTTGGTLGWTIFLIDPTTLVSTAYYLGSSGIGTGLGFIVAAPMANGITPIAKCNTVVTGTIYTRTYSVTLDYGATWVSYGSFTVDSAVTNSYYDATPGDDCLGFGVYDPVSGRFTIYALDDTWKSVSIHPVNWLGASAVASLTVANKLEATVAAEASASASGLVIGSGPTLGSAPGASVSLASASLTTDILIEASAYAVQEGQASIAVFLAGTAQSTADYQVGLATSAQLAAAVMSVAGAMAALSTDIRMSAAATSACRVSAFTRLNPWVPLPNYVPPALSIDVLLLPNYVVGDLDSTTILTYGNARRTVQQHATAYDLTEDIQLFPVAQYHSTTYAATVEAWHATPITYGICAYHMSGYGGTTTAQTAHEASFTIRLGTPVSGAYHIVYGLSVASAHYAGYEGAAEVRSTHTTSYADSLSARKAHSTTYGSLYTVNKAHVLPYGTTVTRRTAHGSIYGVPANAKQTHATLYVASNRIAVAHTSLQSISIQVAVEHTAQYLLTQPVRTSYTSMYDLSTYNKAVAGHGVLWSITGGAELVTESTPYVLAGGRVIPIMDGFVSADHESAAWSFAAQIENTADFAALQTGDEIEFWVGSEVFDLILDTKAIDRVSASSVSMRITAKSRVCLLDVPYAQNISIYIDQPMTAKAAVEMVLGEPVYWEPLDWLLPGGKIVFSDVTPLSIAMRIAAAVGAVLQSNRDGTISVVSRFPVSTEVLQEATPDILCTDDSDIFNQSTKYIQSEQATSLRISEGDSSFSDRLDWTSAPESEVEGTLSMYPSPWRTEVTVEPTSSQINYSTVGVVERVVSEVVEFRDGQAMVQFPVYALTNVLWLAESLGAITFATYSTTINSGTGVNQGYALAEITYRTRSMDYNVQGVHGQQIQFISRSE